MTTRAMLLAIGAVLLIGAMGLLTSQCAKQRNAASQARTDTAQAGAAQNSAADAIGTQGAANERETASEAQTRSSERTIRDAQGSTDAVNPAVRDAGFASLCKRLAFRDSPTGRVRCAPAPGVEARR